MSRPRYTFRPSLQNPDHRKAWRVLCAVQEGQRNNFLVEAILCKNQQAAWETAFRKVLREELSGLDLQPGSKPKAKAPQQALDFLASL